VLGLVGVHLLFVQIQGMSAPDGYLALPPEERKSVSFFGDYLFAEIPVWLLMGALLAFLATFFPRGLAPEADPTAPAPPGIKPEWYFLSQYQALRALSREVRGRRHGAPRRHPALGARAAVLRPGDPDQRARPQRHRPRVPGLDGAHRHDALGVVVMNYPVWDVPGIGAGLGVAIIAIFHVLVSHVAVGGGAFLFIAELWAGRQPDSARIRAWLHAT
jgi:quinol-cytochrome oxidoreductase complex cytochrome b subunit